MATRALIMAGGADTKWTSLGGPTRRHFQTVRGERVIDRIVRQLAERGILDIGIICPPIEGYDIEGTYRIEPTHDAWGHEALNGRAHWSETGRTIQVYGDMIFADPCLDTIAGYEPRTWMMWGRFGNGVVKGGGGELFATSFWPEQADRWEAALLEAFMLKERGLIRRAGSWEAYRIMAGATGRTVGQHRLYPHVFTSIDDRRTDDFDTPDQYRQLVRLFEGP